MFGLGALSSRAFNALISTVQNAPITWGSRGGIGKKHKEEIKKSQRAEMQEHLKTLLDVPEVVQEIKEELQGYVKPSQGFSVHSIDYKKLIRDAEFAEQLIAKARAIQQEQEDEAILLMLM